MQCVCTRPGQDELEGGPNLRTPEELIKELGAPLDGTGIEFKGLTSPIPKGTRPGTCEGEESTVEEGQPTAKKGQ